MKGQKGLGENEEEVEEGVEAVKKGMRAKQLRERERETRSSAPISRAALTPRE